MRADRLVAVLLLLQRRGRVTAAEVAEELEVSERTARRDLDALAMAGIPLYSRQGRGGGWFLVGDGRTDLSGLTAPEARALFLLAGSSGELTDPARAALRKLAHALPEPLRERVDAVERAVLVDPSDWDGLTGGPRAPDELDAIQTAVVDRRRVRFRYAGRDGRRSERTVDPLGVVGKGRHWYLIAETDTGRRTFRVDRMSDTQQTGEAAEIPDGFDLAAAWQDVSRRIDDLRTPVVARARAVPSVLRILRWSFGVRLAVTSPEHVDPVEIEIRGHSPSSLARELARFGGWVEVTEPPEVRSELAEIGRRLVADHEV